MLSPIRADEMNGVAAVEGALPLARSRLEAMSPDYAITKLRETSDHAHEMAQPDPGARVSTA